MLSAAEVRREASCPPHVFLPVNTKADVLRGEVCNFCGISFRDWTRGFNTNVKPPRAV